VETHELHVIWKPNDVGHRRTGLVFLYEFISSDLVFHYLTKLHRFLLMYARQIMLKTEFE